MAAVEPTAAATASAAAPEAPEEEPEVLTGPRPVQIVRIDDKTKEFSLDEVGLQSILGAPEVANLPVVVVSVAGPFRKGKSFLLNFFLRYMHEGETFLEDADSALNGFHWRAGSKRDTTGIWMWSEVFVRTLPGGKQVAVLLLDTQGTFDNKTTMRENATIFALNALLCSYQVYNVSQLVSEDVLQHMHLFTEFGQMVQESESNEDEDPINPFQSLMFLIRDWQYKEEHDYGAKGGLEYLETEVLRDDEQEMDEELRQLRRHLLSCYEQIGCYLMPHPGRKVAGSKQFDGKLSDIDPGFRTQLQDLVPRILSDSSLVVKRVLGDEVTCSGLFNYMKQYLQVFQLGQLPTLSTVFDATAAVNHLNVMMTQLSYYKSEMDKLCGPTRPYIQPAILEQSHAACVDEAVARYHKTRKLHSEKLEQEFEAKLRSDMDETYVGLTKANDSKQILRKFMTPITLAALAFACNLVCTFLSLAGLETIAVLLNYVTWLCIFGILGWVYCDYTGEYAEARGHMDEFAMFVFDHAQSLAVDAAAYTAKTKSS
eukprot:m.16297 g.16297  ORF g.16297 m.16297 type:complete len:541 (-) comp5206_c0_seq2:60-1682(-)